MVLWKIGDKFARYSPITRNAIRLVRIESVIQRKEWKTVVRRFIWYVESNRFQLC